jgi:MoxR-like ATPase
VGTRIYNQKTGEFNTSLGPVFRLLLADEINRAPAKVQSALLEVMQEYRVTIAGKTHRVPSPSWSWPRRIRSKPRARIRCPGRRWTGS